MSVDVDSILELLDQSKIDRDVLLKHDEARETFRLPAITVADHQEFHYLLTSYVQHHAETVGEGHLSEPSAFNEAKRILDHAFQHDRFQEGFAAALQQAVSGADGGMRKILNEIADSLKRRALQNFMDYVYHHHINVLSRADNMELSRAFFTRFGPILKRYGFEIEEDTFAWNTRAALEYHRQVIEHILGIARKFPQ